ncbi:MAG: hypothetical protein ACRBFS_12975 [Aureispira sp.]
MEKVLIYCQQPRKVLLLMELLNFIGRFINYTSVSLLFFGIFIAAFKKHSKNKLIVIYLIGLFLSESIGLYLRQGSLILLTISFFIHFVCLTHFYDIKTFKIKCTLMLLGVLPLLLHCTTDNSLVWLQHYARVPYSLIISLCSLGYFYALMMGKLQNIPSRNILNGSILLFFTIDAFLGTANPYLVKREYLDLVAWFWFFRAIFLEFFYVALIYYGWKLPKET